MAKNHIVVYGPRGLNKEGGGFLGFLSKESKREKRRKRRQKGEGWGLFKRAIKEGVKKIRKIKGGNFTKYQRGQKGGVFGLYGPTKKELKRTGRHWFEYTLPGAMFRKLGDPIGKARKIRNLKKKFDSWGKD